MRADSKPTFEKLVDKRLLLVVRYAVAAAMRLGHGFRPGLYDALPDAVAAVPLDDKEAVHKAIVDHLMRFAISRGEAS